MNHKTEDELISNHVDYLLSAAEQELVALERRRNELTSIIQQMKKLRSEIVRTGRGRQLEKGSA